SIRRGVARSRSLEEIVPECRRYFDEEFAAEPFETALARMAALFTLLLDDLAGRLGTAEVIPRIGDPAAEIPRIRSRAEWDAWAERTLGRIVARRTMRVDEHWPAPLRHAVAHIDAHYTEALHLSSVAGECEISTGYLSRLFSEHLGVSFNDYLNSVRIGAAEALLAAGELSIKEIAFACGYRDPNYFSRIFKRVKGVSPTSFPAGKDHEA
ncbi:MAG: AraC family transcriptional regulator, partial [Spirochaetales bacterium]|nr:AraC family transcriptional regulator [Spirochaetales bacterium]